MLKWLMLQENDMEMLPLTELRFLKSLEWLDLSKNQLTSEWDNFPEQLVSLQEL